MYDNFNDRKDLQTWPKLVKSIFRIYYVLGKWSLKVKFLCPRSMLILYLTYVNITSWKSEEEEVESVWSEKRQFFAVVSTQSWHGL